MPKIKLRCIDSRKNKKEIEKSGEETIEQVIKNDPPKTQAIKKVTLLIERQTGIPIRGGIAANDTIIRTDIFFKEGRYYCIPIYTSAIGYDVLPNRAIVAEKPEEEWTITDHTFKWCFSLYPNDLVRITEKSGAQLLGYYMGIDRANGRLSLYQPDIRSEAGKERKGIARAKNVEKFHVSVLGDIYPAPFELRKPLRSKQRVFDDD